MQAKGVGFAVLILLTVGLSACVTTGFTRSFNSYTPPRAKYNFKATADNNDLKVTIVVLNETDAFIKMENISGIPLVVDWDSFAYKGPDGASARLIHSGVRLIDRDKPQARQTIPAEGMLTDNLVPAFAIYSDTKDGWQTEPWTAIPPAGSSFTIGYYYKEELRFVECKGFDDLAGEDQTEQVVRLGTITASKTYWHLLFIGMPEVERAELLSLAQEKAEAQYGDKVSLHDVMYDSNWNFASLLLYFSMLGWVENASVSATVFK